MKFYRSSKINWPRHSVIPWGSSFLYYITVSVTKFYWLSPGNCEKILVAVLSVYSVFSVYYVLHKMEFNYLKLELRGAMAPLLQFLRRVWGPCGTGTLLWYTPMMCYECQSNTWKSFEGTAEICAMHNVHICENSGLAADKQTIQF